MAGTCDECGATLSFRNSFRHGGKNLCGTCLERLDPTVPIERTSNGAVSPGAYALALATGVLALALSLALQGRLGLATLYDSSRGLYLVLLAAVFGAVHFAGGVLPALIWPSLSWRWGLLVFAPFGALIGFSVLFAGCASAADPGVLWNDLAPLLGSLCGACLGAVIGARLSPRRSGRERSPNDARKD